MKMGQIENCQNKMGLEGCKQSNLNAPGTEAPLFLELDELPVLAYQYEETTPCQNCQNQMG